MTLRIRNRWEYKGPKPDHEGREWWNWQAFLDDDGSGELPQVDHVEYVLHPTFVNPVRTISSPSDGFALRTTGWGLFDLKAFVHMKDGTTTKLTHEVDLRDDPVVGVTV